MTNATANNTDCRTGRKGPWLGKQGSRVANPYFTFLLNAEKGSIHPTPKLTAPFQPSVRELNMHAGGGELYLGFIY